MRVPEFLRMMMMFGGIGPGTPSSFRTIHPDPFAGAGRGQVPFPAKPFPAGDAQRGRQPRVLFPPQSRMESGEDNIESFLVQERQEDRAGRQEEHSGRQRNSSGSKSRILAFVTEAAGRGQS